MKDLAVPNGTPLRHEMVVDIDAPNSLDISDLFLVQAIAPAAEEPTALTRSGREVLPLVDQRISAGVEFVPFYGELYGTHLHFGQDSAFLVVAGFREPEGDWVPGTQRFFRKAGVAVLPLLESIPVPSPGLYDLCVEVQTPQQRTEVARRMAVEVVGVAAQDAAVAARTLSPFVLLHQDRDSLHALVETLLPIADAGERRSIEYSLKEAELRRCKPFWINSGCPGIPKTRCGSGSTGGKWPLPMRNTGIVPTAKATKRTWAGFAAIWPSQHHCSASQRHPVLPLRDLALPQGWPVQQPKVLFYTPQVVGECFELLHSDHPQELRNVDWLDILKTRELGHSVAGTSINQLGQRDTYSREEPEDLFFNPR